jgi:hypothetical protein
MWTEFLIGGTFWPTFYGLDSFLQNERLGKNNNLSWKCPKFGDL